MVAIFVLTAFLFILSVDLIVLKIQGKNHPAFEPLFPQYSLSYDGNSFTIPSNTVFTKGHTWLKKNKDGLIIIGIDSFGTTALGNLSVLKCAEVGTKLNHGEMIFEGSYGNKKIKSISKEAMDFLMGYNWPGNVRELENAIERAMVVGKFSSITVDDLPFHVSRNNFELAGDEKSLSSVERKYIFRILNENNWNISKTAQILEIDRVTLYNKISKYDLRKAE